MQKIYIFGNFLMESLFQMKIGLLKLPIVKANQSYSLWDD